MNHHTMKFILSIALWMVAMAATGQVTMHEVTVKSHIVTQHELDSMLNGTWQQTSTDSITFLNFNHHLLFEYKTAKGTIEWDDTKQQYTTGHTIDTLLYKAFSLKGEGNNPSIDYEIERTTKESYDYSSTVIYAQTFGWPSITKDTLSIFSPPKYSYYIRVK